MRTGIQHTVFILAELILVLTELRMAGDWELCAQNAAKEKGDCLSCPTSTFIPC
jgi:hypothetical protein